MMIERPKKIKRYGYYPYLFSLMLEEAKKNKTAELKLEKEEEYQNIYVTWKRQRVGVIRREKRLDGNVYAVLSYV